VIEGEAEKGLRVVRMISKCYFVFSLGPTIIEYIHKEGEKEVQAGELLLQVVVPH
jgi:hypothetical protein